MLYLAEGQVYVVANGECHGCDVTAKDKVTEVRELAGVSIEKKAKAELPKGAFPVTVDELVAKVNLSESNPCLFKGKAAKPGKESKEK